MCHLSTQTPFYTERKGHQHSLYICHFQVACIYHRLIYKTTCKRDIFVSPVRLFYILVILLHKILIEVYNCLRNLYMFRLNKGRNFDQNSKILLDVECNLIYIAYNFLESRRLCNTNQYMFPA